jgi:CDP-diacylglycerol--serine O-phosphatidyltransferase
MACWLVFAGAFFDVFDGLAARALGGGTPLGAQLDSLADMVTFGVAPAFLLFTQSSMLGWNLFDPSRIQGFEHLPYPNMPPHWPQKVGAMLIGVASCWRLAKFNSRLTRRQAAS